MHPDTASELNWRMPYPSHRSPVMAQNIVATSQPLAASAGLEILQQGGNAVDAAIATAITLTVVEPNNNGLGSDAFAILWDGQKLHGLNASGKSPAGWNPERFQGLEHMPALGWDSVTVPGAVGAWASLSEHFGRLPFGDLFQRAIHYAREGFQVGPKTARYWQHACTTYAGYPDYLAHFCPQGTAPKPGSLFRRPDMVNSLESIAESKGESFYRGELAAAMIADSRAKGGAMTLEDLAQHETLWVDPLAQAYRGVALHEIPPNGQGMAAQIALGILSHFDLKALDPDGDAAIHYQLEAMKIAIRAAFEHFADPAAMHVSPSDLLGEETLAAAANSISDTARQAIPALLPGSEDTVYLTTADADGMMVSFIQSNYFGFGSGVVVPGTGISMQCRGAGFSLQPGHPNQVGGGKRPFHTIIPGFVTEQGRPKMSFGVMGGHMQHQGHVQMVTRIFDAGQNPQAAIDAPRWHIYRDYSIGVEHGFSEATAQALEKRGHRVRFEPLEHVFGGAQIIYRLQDGYCAGSEPRKEGQAVGY